MLNNSKESDSMVSVGQTEDRGKSYERKDPKLLCQPRQVPEGIILLIREGKDGTQDANPGCSLQETRD